MVPFGPSYQIPRILTLAILAASASVHAEAQERARALSFGTGWYDFVQKRDPAMEARVEYRVGPAARPLRGIVVATITEDAAMFLGVGIGYELKLGRRWILTPTFTPGYYREGKGKDLGYPLEFRSQLEIGYEFRRGYRVLMAVSHSSNAGLGRSQPGSGDAHARGSGAVGSAHEPSVASPALTSCLVPGPDQDSFTEGAGKFGVGFSYQIPRSKVRLYIEGAGWVYKWDRYGFDKTQFDTT